MPPAELKEIPTVCGSLREALGYLDKDRAFLKAGGVFDDDFINSYIDLKMTGNHPVRAHPASGRVRHVLLGVSVPPNHRASVPVRCNFWALRKGRPFCCRKFRRSGGRRGQAPRRCQLQWPASADGVAWARRRRQHGGQRLSPHQIRPNSQIRRPTRHPRARRRPRATTAQDSENATWAHGNADRVNERLRSRVRADRKVVRRWYCAAISRGKHPMVSRAHVVQR